MYTCHICLSKKLCGSKNYCSTCSSSICKQCLQEWFKDNQQCPICRSQETIVDRYKHTENTPDIEGQYKCIRKIYPETFEETDELSLCSRFFKYNKQTCLLIWKGSRNVNYEISTWYVFLLFTIMMAFLGYVGELLLFKFTSDDYKRSFKEAHVSFVFYATCPLVGFMIFMTISILYNIKQCFCNYNQ
jgi:hypothetical protein